jgi:hypothetical protein
LAAVAPALMVTLAGILSNSVLRVNATVTAEEAGFVKATVHVALWPLLNVAGVQLNEDN